MVYNTLLNDVSSHFVEDFSINDHGDTDLTFFFFTVSFALVSAQCWIH